MYDAADEEAIADDVFVRLFTAAEETSNTPLLDLKSVEQPWMNASAGF